MKEKASRTIGPVPRRWPVSRVLKSNTTDMQRLTDSRTEGAQCAHISRKTTGVAAGGDFGGHRASGGPGNATGGGALGINAKSSVFSAMGRRVERFALQSVARSILPKSRTAKCLRIRAFDRDVQVWKSKEHKTASYAGLQTCGSVWACPVCAAKIAERRRAELQQAMEMHKASGGSVLLLTLTTPHQRGDVLSELLAQQGGALESFFADTSVKKVLAEMGNVGKVRALEVTHGRKGTNNGWHPHFHILLFCGSSISEADRKDFAARLYLRWSAYCQKAGLGTPSYTHGIQLDSGDKASDYVAKWGLEDEMTKGHIKKAKAGGETPFDLLRAVLADKQDKQAMALFKEFAECFKGKRQLSWSKGLKARFYLDEKTDDELANEKDDRAVLLGLISVDQWRDVLKMDARSTVLELAANTGWEDVQRFLDIIKNAHAPDRLESPVTPEIVREARQILLGIP